jgi:molybdenum cofactor biosynthesis protein B
MTGNTEEHPHKREDSGSLLFKILTVSSSRSLKEDGTGDLIRNLLEKAGHKVQERRVVKDEVELIRSNFMEMLEGDPHIIIINGGTGVTPKDVTVEAVRPLFQKELAAFSALFAYVSFEQIGPAALLSRACAGIVGQTAIFCLPGSSGACQLAMDRLIVPEASHLMAHVRSRV